MKNTWRLPEGVRFFALNLKTAKSSTTNNSMARLIAAKHVLIMLKMPREENQAVPVPEIQSQVEKHHIARERWNMSDISTIESCPAVPGILVLYPQCKRTQAPQ